MKTKFERRPIVFRVPSILCLLLSAACAQPSDQTKKVAFASGSISRDFELVQSVRFQQRDSALLIRASGVAVAPDVRIAVGDASEGNIKLYGPDGTLLAILGRKGIPGNANADSRVARSSKISSGKKCSAKAAMGAANSGGTSGKRYSSLNSDTAESDRCDQPSWMSPLTMSITKPSTLVCPDFQNTAAIEKRPTKAIKESGMRVQSWLNVCSKRATDPDEWASLSGCV